MTDQPQLPIAKQKPYSSTFHGVELQDPWHWLRDPSYPDIKDEEILSYLREENDYFEAQMKPHAALVEEIFQEMKARIKEEDQSVPQTDGDYTYWRRFEKGAQYRQWLRKAVAGGADQIILDEPKRAEGHDYFSIGAMTISEDDKLLAWSVDTDGSERYTVTFTDLATGKDLPDRIEGTLSDFVFSRDGSCLIYGQVNENWRVDRIMLHKMGTPQSEDILIYEELDQGFAASVGMTQDRQWIIISTGDNETSEVRLLPADDPLAAPLVVLPRKAGLEYYVDTHGDTLFIMTNDVSPQFRLVTAPISAPDKWSEKIAPSDDFYMMGVTCFADFFVVEGRERGLDQVDLHSYDGKVKRIPFAEASYVVGLDENPEYAVTKLRLGYESMVSPSSVLEYDVPSGKITTLKVQEIPSGYDASQYTTERLEIEARDGVKVPVSIVYRKDFKRDGSHPLYLYAYGAYGTSIPPGFSTVRLSYLDRGFAFAVAHIRGGDDLGQQWHLDGKREKRTNTFNDFIDCAQGLVKLGYTGEGRIVASGGSAGGKLMGVVTNDAPELWGAIAAHVPFVDVINTMLDESLPLTPGEWPEWGNPITDKAAFDLMLSYSPYDQVEAKDYPPILVTAGLNDPRVTYWEPAKWVAKMRATKTDDNLLLLKTNMGAGHAGKTGRFETLREEAEEIVFFLWQLGMLD